jgi:glycosyltransferase involved in cell wall biosynthesis
VKKASWSCLCFTSTVTAFADTCYFVSPNGSDANTGQFEARPQIPWTYPTDWKDTGMNVCMVAYTFYESDNRVMRYAECLAQRGDNVEVLGLRQDGQSFRTRINGVTVFHLQRRTRNEKNRLSYVLKLLLFFIKAMAVLSVRQFRSHYALIHVHNLPDFLVFAAWLPKIAGAKVILDIHDLLPEFYANKFHGLNGSLWVRMLLTVERASARFADHVIAANPLWYDRLTSRSVSPKNSSVFLNYPDASIFRPKAQKRADGRFIIIFPGSLNAHQGVDIAIRSVALIHRLLPNAEFHIYGEGADKSRLVQLARELGVAKQVLFMRTLPLREIAARVADADLGVVPKRADSFGNEAFSTKILEFMCAGIPVIVSSTRIDRYYFNDSVVMFSSSDDDEDLARCILLLAGDEARRSEMVRNGSDFVRTMTWDRHKSRYFELVDSLLRGLEIGPARTGNEGGPAAGGNCSSGRSVQEGRTVPHE